MKNINKNIYTLVIGVAIGFTIPSHVHAQFGGLKKVIPPVVGGGSGGDSSVNESEIFNNFSPASVALKEAAILYKEALDLKIKDNTEGAKKKSEGAVVIANMEIVNAVAKELSKAAQNPDKINMSPEQKEKFIKAHAKLLEGGGKFMVVSATTALAIKKITESNPAALVGHPELVQLGVICAKDATILLGLLSDSSKFAKAKAIKTPEGGSFDSQKTS